MPRVYTAIFDNVSVTALQDLFELTPAANKPIEILGFSFSQTGNADVGDVAEELLPLQLIRGFTTSGSGGTTPTPAPFDAIDTAAGCVVEANNTTVANTGTTATLWSDNFNVRAGYTMLFPPDMRPRCSAAETRIVLKLPRSPADAILLSGTITFREL